MRLFARLLAATMIVASIALAGASSVLAADASANGAVSMPLDDSWCFTSPYGGPTYCNEVDGKVTFVDSASGSGLTVNQRVHTVVYENGVVIGEYTDTSLLHSTFSEDGTYAVQDVTHTRASFDGQRCTFTTVFRLADFEVVVDHVSGVVCS